MPGIVGYWSADSANESAGIVGRMLGAISVGRAVRVTRRDLDDVNLAMGIVTCADLPLQRSSAQSSDGADVLFIDGELFSSEGKDLDEDSERAVVDRLRSARDCREVLSVLRALDGVFSFVLFKRHSGQLIVGVDPFGIKPIFYHEGHGHFAFSSEVKTLAPLLADKSQIDHEAFANLFLYGFVLENRTHFSEISRVPPGSILIFDLEHQAAEIRSYWQLGALFSPPGTSDPNISHQDLIQAFTRAVKRRLRHKDKLCLALSGGLDSRAILAAMGTQAQGLSTHTVGVMGCGDQSVAQRLAAIAGARNDFVSADITNPCDPIEELDNLVRTGDGFVLSTDYLGSVWSDYFSASSLDVRLSGHGAEAAKVNIVSPVRAMGGLGNDTTISSVIGHVENQARQLRLTDKRVDELFTPLMAEAIKTYRETSVRDSFRDLNENVDPTDVVVYWYLHTWLSRVMVSHLTAERVEVESRLPFIDRELLVLLLRALPEVRTSAALQIETIRCLSPEMAGIRNVNTGTRLGAGVLRSLVSQAYRKIASRLGLSGYRHYSHVGVWQRGAFAPAIREVLLEERTLERGLYNPDGLTRSIADYFAGDDSLANLITPMMSLEIWFRRIVDGGGSSGPGN